MLKEVFQANLGGDLGTFGNASYKLISQHEFPHIYDTDKDILLNVDHDRLDLRRIYRDYNFRDVDLGKNIASAGFETAFKVLKEIFSMVYDDVYKPIWTGYRIMGTVDKSNGFVVWSLCLFAKVNPETKVYSGYDAPNVYIPDELKDKKGRLIRSRLHF